MPLTVGAIKPDSRVNATVLRDGKKKIISVRVGELPKDPSVAFNNTDQNILGLIVDNQPNNPNNSISGILVTGVDSEGIAYSSGIRQGDIIYSLGRARINNVEEFKAVLEGLDTERNTTIGIARNGIKRILSLNLSK